MTQLETRVIEAVRRYGVAFEVIEINPAFADTEDFCREYGFPPEKSGNTILVASKKEPKRFAACIVPATARLDVNHTVKRRLGVSRASFARVDEMQALTGMEVGGVTPFALPGDVPIYVDPALTKLDWIILGAGGRGAKIKISPAVFDAMPNAEVVPGLSDAG